jgi:predicted O-methyltransferase YrrM
MDATSRIISVDIDQQLQAVAREFLGDDPRLELICADAAIFVTRQMPASFDLIFADAIPGKYEHLDETLALLRRGGLYVVDDMLPQPTWPKDHAPRVTGLLSQLAKRSDLIGVGLAWASGVLVLTRR